MEHVSDGNITCNWRALYSLERIDAGTGGLENKWTSEDHPNYIIVKIGQNTEKSPGNSSRFAVTQTPVKDHQLTLT